jgi:LacI family transcriptional regulator
MYDAFTGEFRFPTVKDVGDSALVVDALDAVDVYSQAMVGRDAPNETADLLAAEAVLSNTTKHCHHIDLASGKAAARYIEMGAAIAGGMDQLRKRPVISALICPTSPLQMSNHGSEIIMEFARAGVPINILSMGLAGGTTPVTLAGTLVVHNCEILGGIVLNQLTCKGSPVIYGSSTTTFDMRCMTAPVGSPELGMIAAGVAALAQHYNLMLAPLSGDGDIVARVEDLVMQSRLDGMVLTPPVADDEALLAWLDRHDIPYASISPKEQHRRIGVVLDERSAMREMILHLASLGHRRIAHIQGHPAHGASAWRLAGYCDGLRQMDLPCEAELVVQGMFSYESGFDATHRLLALVQPPTAIVAANDDMAAGAICAICERGLSVPKDVSVCGFDDTPIARHIYPALTTVRQPTREMARLAALELLKAVRNHAAGGLVQVPYTLQLRRSTGPAP